MNPSDVRDGNWDRLQERLTKMGREVYEALLVWGPCTTRELAERAELDLLTVRPRVTELCQAGLAECVRLDEEERRAREGVYRAKGRREVERAMGQGRDTHDGAEQLLLV